MELKQAVHLQSVANARELGGYPAAEGRVIRRYKLLRSGALHGLSHEDMARLGGLGLTAVVDFRDQAELDRAPDVIPPGARYFSVPVIEQAGENPAAKAAMAATASLNGLTGEAVTAFLQSMGGAEGIKTFMLETYEGIARSKTSGQAYRRFFDLLLQVGEQDGALLFHCRAGKDRTGIAAALLLTVLGTPNELILEDYLLTNAYMTKETLRQLSGLVGEEQAEKLIPLIGVEEGSLDAFYREIQGLYGSLDSYLENILGVTREKREKLLTWYTEPK